MKSKIILEDTYNQLYKNTSSAFPDTKEDSARVQVNTTAFIPSENGLEVRAKTRTNKEQYDTIAFFQNVQYTDESDPQSIQFMGPDGGNYNIIPIDRNENVQVTCTCLNFHWRYAVWNSAHNSLYGDAPDPYIKKTQRPPQNPRHLPGLCKHLIKLFEIMKKEGIVK